MAEQPTCQRCGRPRAADAPLPLCARCAIALVEEEQPGIDWAAVSETGWAD